MFATRQSRKNLFSLLQVLLVAAAIGLNLFATYGTNWINAETVAGWLIGAASLLAWIIMIIAYGISLAFLKDDESYKLFTAGTGLGMLVAPVLSVLGAWNTTGTFAAFITDALIVVGWIFTVVMVVWLIFDPPEYISQWIQSGEDAEQARQNKRAAREAKKAAAEAEKTRKRNLASNGEPIDLSLAEDPDAHLSEYTATSESGSPSTS